MRDAVPNASGGSKAGGTYGVGSGRHNRLPITEHAASTPSIQHRGFPSATEKGFRRRSRKGGARQKLEKSTTPTIAWFTAPINKSKISDRITSGDERPGPDMRAVAVIDQSIVRRHLSPKAAAAATGLRVAVNACMNFDCRPVLEIAVDEQVDPSL